MSYKPTVNIDVVSANAFNPQTGAVYFNDPQGEVAARFIQNGGKLNPAAMRPWLDPKTGRSYITVHVGGDPRKKENYRTMPVNNANTSLLYDEWKLMDEELMRIVQDELVGLADLREYGLEKTIGNGMGHTVFQYQEIMNELEVELSMDGITRGKNNAPIMTLKQIPLPILHVDYEFNERMLQVSRNDGVALDVEQVTAARRAINEKIEDMLFTDFTYAYAGGTIYSYTNHPDRVPLKMTTSWLDSSMTSALICTAVSGMVQELIDIKKTAGGLVLYLPTAYFSKITYKSPDKEQESIYNCILQNPKIKKIVFVDRIVGEQVFLIQMNTETVRWLNGMGMQNIMWNSEGGMRHHFKAMTIQLPQIRSDYLERLGIVHLKRTV